MVYKRKAGRPTVEESRQMRHPSSPRQKRVAGPKNKTYTEKQKMEAACAFAVAGNSRRVSEITGIPEGTIRSWKNTEWWFETMEQIQKEENEELDTKLTALLNKAVDTVNDRLENGDVIYDTKRGILAKKPVSGKDAAIITAITLDKRQLLRGQPTSRVERISQDERLSKLAEQFKKFSEAKEIKNVQYEVIDAVVVEETQEE
jgi:hypothetical protein